MATTANVTKSWTEIKLSNPDSRTCEQVSIMMDDFHEASASKALERLIRSYSADKAAKQDMRQQLDNKETAIRKLEIELETYKNKLRSIIKTYESFRYEISTGIDTTDRKPQQVIK